MSYLLLLCCLSWVHQCRLLWGSSRAFWRSSTISNFCVRASWETWICCVQESARDELCTSSGLTGMCVYVCVCVWTCSPEVCAPLKGSTHRHASLHRRSCLFLLLCSRLVAPFPGSSHLPTLLLFVAFQSWEKQRQLVGATAILQWQAVFLQKKVEQKKWRADRESSSLGAPLWVFWGEGAPRPGRQLWSVPVHGWKAPIALLYAAQCGPTNTCSAVCFTPKLKLPDPAWICRTSS